MKLRGLEGDLFERKSAACHESLELLRSEMIDAGFHVHKKPRRHSTLKVYLRHEDPYPLLNPRFVLHVDEEKEMWYPLIEITVLSRERTGAYSKQLKNFPRHPSDTFFFPADEFSDGYQIHGEFVIAIPMTEVSVENDATGDVDDGESLPDGSLPEDPLEDEQMGIDEDEGDEDADEEFEDDREFVINYAELKEPLLAIRDFLGKLKPPVTPA